MGDSFSGDAAVNYTETFTVPPEYAALSEALGESTRVALPRDIAEYPAAQARVEQLAEDYASVEVDRLPPMGTLHWLVTGHRADGGADVFRVGSGGSLMPWGAR
jgi:hypothetical protein